MNQTNQDVDLRKIVVFTLAADAIIQEVKTLNLTANDVLILKMPNNTTYGDMDELSTHINNLAGDKKFGILMESHGTSYETMTIEELIEVKSHIESLLESRDA